MRPVGRAELSLVLVLALALLEALEALAAYTSKV